MLQANPTQILDLIVVDSECTLNHKDVLENQAIGRLASKEFQSMAEIQVGWGGAVVPLS